MAKIKSFAERIADALVEDGLLSASQIEELLERQRKEGARLVKLLVDKDKQYVSPDDLAVCMGRVLNVSPINLARVNILPEVVELIPRDMAHNHKVVPVSRLENKLFLAMADPLNVLAIDDVRRITKLEIAPLIASEKAITEKLNAFDAAKSGSMEDIIQDAEKKQRRRGGRRHHRIGQGSRRGNQPRPARRLQRRSAGHQAGQPHHSPGHQGPRQRHSPGAV